MTIEMNNAQEKALQRLIEAGHYASPQDFLDEALAEAYSHTEEFTKLAREKLAASQKDIEAGRVVTVTPDTINDILDQHRNGTLEAQR